MLSRALMFSFISATVSTDFTARLQMTFSGASASEAQDLDTLVQRVVHAARQEVRLDGVRVEEYNATTQTTIITLGNSTTVVKSIGFNLAKLIGNLAFLCALPKAFVLRAAFRGLKAIFSTDSTNLRFRDIWMLLKKIPDARYTLLIEVGGAEKKLFHTLTGVTTVFGLPADHLATAGIIARSNGTESVLHIPTAAFVASANAPSAIQEPLKKLMNVLQYKAGFSTTAAPTSLAVCSFSADEVTADRLCLDGPEGTCVYLEDQTKRMCQRDVNAAHRGINEHNESVARSGGAQFLWMALGAFVVALLICGVIVFLMLKRKKVLSGCKSTPPIVLNQSLAQNPNRHAGRRASHRTAASKLKLSTSIREGSRKKTAGSGSGW